MKLKSMRCPDCGANLNVDPSSDVWYCSHCGTKIYVEDEHKKRLDFSFNEKMAIEKLHMEEREKERQRAIFMKWYPKIALVGGFLIVLGGIIGKFDAAGGFMISGIGLNTILWGFIVLAIIKL